MIPHLPRRATTAALFLVLFLAASIFPALAAGPPTAPMLRLNLGMHTIGIRRIASDAAGRILATASEDKTVHIWDISTGRLLQVLRMPLGEGAEGMIYAVAMSPDGATVACSGYTGSTWDGAVSIYLFDRQSGRLTQRLTGLDGGVNHLAYSPDGRYLAAGLGSNKGVRVWRVSDYSLLGEDRDFSGQTYGLAFDLDNRLAATAFDGFIRIYSISGQGLRRLEKRKAPGGEQPYGVSFSPDGAKVVVGYATTRVDVLWAKDLSLAYTPDRTGVTKGLSSVAWSRDGTRLYAGGQFEKADKFPIRVWPEAGQGQPTDFEAAGETILDLLPLHDGRLVFGAGDPSWGVLDAYGRRIHFQEPPVASFDRRNSPEVFALAPDASRVRFGYLLGGKSPAVFDLAARSLKSSESQDPAMSVPRTQAPGLEVTDWEEHTEPKLNGKPLVLLKQEMSSRLALAPDNQGLVLGSIWYLRRFDRQGREIWSVRAPGVVMAVNVSANGKTVAAAIADGTIRWYSYETGKELLAFFPHRDRKRWVLWTPGGYYDASPGAEDLIGWHVNNGIDRAADFFPASRFRAARLRPDVIDLALSSKDEADALAQANAKAERKSQAVALEQVLPPVASILAPTDGSTATRAKVTLRYTVRSPSGRAVTALRALVDGRPAEVLQSPAAQGQVEVTIPERDCEVALVAECGVSVGVPVVVRLVWRGQAQKPPQAPEPQAVAKAESKTTSQIPAQSTTASTFEIRPKLYILAVGVSKYQNKELTLDFAAKDATDFSRALQVQKGLLYRDVEVRLLADAGATKDAILDGLEWLQRQTTSKDVSMAFFAGHGENDPTGVYHYLPVNFDSARFKATALPYTDIKNAVAAIAGKALFFVDTCHSGNVLGDVKRRGSKDMTPVINELASAENGVVVFAASTGRQYSAESSAWGNGAFTKALVEGLMGKADYHNKGRITVNMLDLYLSERVKELTKGQQTPTTAKPQTVPDFPIAVVAVKK